MEEQEVVRTICQCEFCQAKLAENQKPTTTDWVDWSQWELVEPKREWENENQG